MHWNITNKTHRQDIRAVTRRSAYDTGGIPTLDGDRYFQRVFHMCHHVPFHLSAVHRNRNHGTGHYWSWNLTTWCQLHNRSSPASCGCITSFWRFFDATHAHLLATPRASTIRIATALRLGAPILVHFVSCQKVDNRAFLVKSVKFSAQSHKSV